ncbi:hypothetical protein [Ferrimonas marina]|uniref:Uncharacterized protein n=1 Tax=Ferrimonas marina TaxID=299255 RepID=A0A1M5U8I3_9GAMM|nr:hypothetical protein [Ferrimonas marina]SHH59259.1 hypothetical protein SAMN02745129_2452 [Ferrimonas marina]
MNQTGLPFTVVANRPMLFLGQGGRSHYLRFGLSRRQLSDGRRVTQLHLGRKLAVFAMGAAKQAKACKRVLDVEMGRQFMLGPFFCEAKLACNPSERCWANRLMDGSRLSRLFALEKISEPEVGVDQVVQAVYLGPLSLHWVAFDTWKDWLASVRRKERL